MPREYLSNALTVPLKYVLGAMLAGTMLAAIAGLSYGRFEILLVLVLVGAIAGLSWIQCVVFIENEELVVERFGKSVRLRPEDIGDVTYFGPTSLLKVSFTRYTELGKWIVFGARTRSAFHRDGPISGDGPTFKRLGDFCGWRND